MLIKKLRVIFLILLFFTLFISCENPIQYNEDENQNSIITDAKDKTSSEKYAIIYGFYQNCGGALPADIQKSIAKSVDASLDFQNRSALPALGSELNQIEYYTVAKAQGELPVTGSISQENKTFSISGLKLGINWDIEVGINVKQTAEDGTVTWNRCFYDIAEDVNLSEEVILINRILTLKPDTRGYGSVDLDLTTDSTITDLEIKLDDAEQNDKWQAAMAADDEKEISASKIKLANLPAGRYDLTLLFSRSGESYSCYSTSQTIIIINGMTTDTWQSDGTSLISTTGEFNLTSAIISNYVDSCIYVGPNSASSSIGVTPDNSNEGRAYSPLASVNEAIKRIKNANVSRNYKIFVSGSISENIKIGGEGADVLPGTAASSITIQGLNNNAADVLTSPYLSTAPCLSIQTDIPVIFKNIKITTNQNTFLEDYSSSEKGGGLYIKTGETAPGVTLDSGAWVDGCIISGTGARGAGIYLDSGKLTIKTGAKISNNHFPDSSGFGGGIYIKSGAELILSGSFEMPYGGSTGQNDIYEEAADSIKIKNPIIPRAGTSGPIATITPAASFGRGTRIISLYSDSGLSSITPYKNYFAISGSDWFLKASSTDNALVLDSPFYVAGTGYTVCSASGSSTGNGTKSSPFETIEQAVNAITALNVRDEYAIYVDGEIIGQQTIPASFTSDKASSLTIQGASGNTDDILNGNSEGSVLTISSTVSVTIKDLKITGGNTTGNGGGINMISGTTVTLESGALIGGTNESDPTSGSAPANSETASANYAAKGGGIYSEGSLTLKNGSAVIYNYGTDGGGICCNGGSLTIEAGAKVNLNGTNTTGGGISITGSEFSMTGGEVCNNISTYGGAGGIYIGGTCPDLMTIDGAEISGNTADAHGDAGGLLYDGGEGKTLSITGNTIISGNHCAFEGGGIRIASGILDLSGGTISNNYSLVTDGRVGGVASIHQSILKLSGSVYIPSGAVINGEFINEPRCNGVRSNHNLIKITGEFTPPSECTDGIIATITPDEYIRGTAIFEAEGNVTDLTPYKDKFALTYEDDGWELKLTPDNTALKLDAPIYVKGTGSSVCTGAAVSDGNGSKSAPFDSINHALSVMTNKDLDYTIYIDGEVTGSCRLENIKTDGTGTYNARTILITGAHEIVSGSQRTDIIKQSGFDRVMVINTEVPVTITNLKITGGNTTGYGGGIYQWTNTTLTLGDDALIEGNHAGRDGTSDAGGVYVASGANLNIAGNAVVSGNTAGADGTDTHASNVYLDGGVINITGALVNSKDSTKKANIGVSSSTAPTLTSTIAFTANYGTYNTGIAPGTYFTGDQWTVAWGSGTTAGEAVLAASGGNITVEPIYEDITINIDKVVVETSESEKKFTFSAVGTDAEGHTNSITIGSGEGQLNLIIDSVTYHGETVPASYCPTGANYVTFSNSMPAGNYTINTRAVYQGSLSAARTYSASFDVKIVDEILTTFDSAPTEGTWTISSQIGLEKLAEWGQAGALNPGATYILENDVTLSNWTSMGNFEGTFDGNDHTITILSLAEGSKNIFGDVRNSSSNIKNLTVAGSITGEYQGLVGILGSSDQGVNNHWTRMENCVNKVNITYTGTSYCGGLAGKAGSTYSQIINCRNEGNITALNSSKVGGITGESGSTANSIIHCINTGNITGKNNVGGICGGSTGTIRDCMNSGTVKGETYVGGLCGNQVAIYNCINTGTVMVTKINGYLGGICGYYSSNSRNITNCINRGSVTTASGVTSTHIGAIAGNTANNITKTYYLSTDSIVGIGGETANVSGNCDSFTKSGSACLTSSDITVGTYTGKDVVSLLNAFVDGGNVNTDNLITSFPPKRWKYDSSGNIEFDE